LRGDAVRRASRRSDRLTHHPEETQVPARRPRSLSLALALVLAAAPLGAQTADPGSALAAPAATATEAALPATTAEVPGAPMAAAAPAALTAPTRATAELGQEQAALQARAQRNFSQSQVLMIVGGAALISGLIIGDGLGDVLAIGGAGVGLYGLYRFLQGR
jgi:hypothetical protein